MIYSGVYPACASPSKSQMEQLFRSMKPEGITAKVIADFGLVRSSFNDEWEINVSLNKARKAFAVLYESLPQEDKLLFQMAFFNPAIDYIREIMENMAEAGLELIMVEKAMAAALHQDVLQRLSRQIAEKI